MSLLTKVSTGRKGRAQKVVVYAPEGFGKSTLASRFPDPLFLDVEDSTSQLDVNRLSRADLPDLSAFESALAEIVGTPSACTTLVVDTMDWLEQMALDAIVAAAGSDKIKGIEDFGYGKGYTILRERVTVLLARFDAIVAKGITVVLLAHSKVTKFEPPDGAGPYDRYELKLSKQVAPLVKEWADMLVFANWKTQVREKDKNEAGQQFKGVGGRERVLYFNRCAAWDAKNRHGLGDVEPWGKDASDAIKVFERAFVSVGAPWGNGAAPSVESGTKAASPVTASGAEKSTTADPKTAVTEKPAEEKKPAVAEKPAEKPAESKPAEPEATIRELQKPAADADDIPGLPKSAEPPVDAELERILKPHAEQVNAYLLKNGRIAAGQDWRHVTPEFASRIKKNPAGFLKVAVRAEGVAA